MENRVGVGDSAKDVAESAVPWHRQAVGGLWEEVGQLQFDFLRSEGLLPSHRLLDIGCGSLRGGVKFIAYLEPGNYYGVDADKDLLDAGRDELALYSLSGRMPHLRQTADFDLDFGCRFPFALAQSVFTHLAFNSIHRCILELEKHLEPGGRFYATCFVGPGRESQEPVSHKAPDGSLISFLDRDPFHYDIDIFRWLCENSSLSFTYIGPWHHPRDQHMLLFQKR